MKDRLVAYVEERRQLYDDGTEIILIVGCKPGRVDVLLQEKFLNGETVLDRIQHERFWIYLNRWRGLEA